MTGLDQIIRQYKGYTLVKEHYAQGISLYDYQVTKDGTDVYMTFSTLREARAWIDTQEGRQS